MKVQAMVAAERSLDSFALVWPKRIEKLEQGRLRIDNDL
jgi:hypothetical protein